jgi:nucleotide-binding universal stress UspA family protein
MFNTVLVGIDEHTRGRDAIALALQLVSPSGKLILGHVHPGSAIHAKGDNGEFEAVEREVGLELLLAVSEELGREMDLRSIGDDRVGAGLHRMAEESQADLLVLGSSYGGPSGQVLLRPETRHAINGLPCAAAVAPTGYADRSKRIREIGIAYNGSPESQAALRLARALAQDIKATAHVFEAVSLPAHRLTPSEWETDEDAVYDRCRVRREYLADETGLHATVACGNAVEQIAFFSSIVDLLIVGSRGYGPLGRLVHGSTTHRLLCCAHSPVLVLTRATRSVRTITRSRDLAEAGTTATTEAGLLNLI